MAPPIIAPRPEGASGTAALADIRWLVSCRAARWLERAAAHGGSTTSLAALLRKDLTREQSRLVLDQVALRHRAAGKFSRASSMYFRTVLLEQATDERIAEYKARRFNPTDRVVDLCCGLGGDLQALGRRVGICVGADRDPLAAVLAAANARAAGCSNVISVVARADGVLLQECDAWHADPDRRNSGYRTTRPELLDPAWPEIRALQARHGNGAVKLASATRVTVDSAEREWIGSRGECRQQVVWWGRLARHHQHTATVVHQDGRVTRFDGEPQRELPHSAHARRFIFEPHPAVLAARLEGALAARFDLARFTFTTAFLTADVLRGVPLCQAFEVLEILPLDLRRLRSVLRCRRWSVQEVKQRGAVIQPDLLKRRLRSDGEPVTLLAAARRGSTWAAIARRVEDREDPCR